MNKINLSWDDVRDRAGRVAREIEQTFPQQRTIKVYPVPRGGIPAAQAVIAVQCLPRSLDWRLVEDHHEADVIIDDLIDSGATRERFSGRPFYTLLDKRDEGDSWIEFPWERVTGEVGPEENIRRLIEYIGDDPKREGLLETPKRVIAAYRELFSGYGKSPEDVIKTFKDGSCDEMVVVRDVEFTSHCEHHMLPFFGRAHIAYIPDGRVIGVSKLVRLLEIYARRLQIQERLCQQVTDALDKYLEPLGSACIIEAKHLCMTARGVAKQHSMMVTSSLTGVFREKTNAARQELLSVIRDGA